MPREAPPQAAEERGCPGIDLRAAAEVLDGVVASHVRKLVEGQLADIRSSLLNLEAHLLNKASRAPGGRAEEDVEVERRFDDSNRLQFADDEHTRDAVAHKALSGNPGLPAGSSLASSVSDHEQLNHLWRLWAEEGPDSARSAAPLAMPAVEGSLKVRWVHPDDCGSFRSSRGKCEQRVVIRPTSHFRFFWDFASLTLLCYDIFLIPLSVFEVGVSGPFKFVDLLITLFWSFDVVVCFLSGFYKVGVVELRWAEIARNYVHGTFIFDMCVLMIDWILTLSEFIEIGAIRLMRMGKLIRFGKVFRMLRLSRVLKLPMMLRDITDKIQSKSLQTAWGVAKACAYIAVVNHYIACFWFQVSTIMYLDYDVPTWVERLHDEGRRPGLYFYLTALHWSVTQFTPASMEVQPRNSVERIFVIIVVFGALIVFSTFVSSITTAMTRLREHNRERFHQVETINNYLTDKKISYDLRCRIGSFLRAYNFLGRRTAHEQDVAMFKALPMPLKFMLRFEAHGPILAKRPFFFQLNEYDAKEFIQICYGTITEIPVNLARELFTPGQDASDMYFLIDGLVEYSMNEDTQQFAATNGNVIFCEAALWIRFHHPGRLFCKTSSEFLAMSSASFRGVVPHKPEFHSCCRTYASQFLSVLQTVESEGMPVTEKFDLDVIAFDVLQEMAQKAFERAYWTAEGSLPSGDDTRNEFREIAMEHHNHPEASCELQARPSYAR